MLVVHTKNAVAAWRQMLVQLIENGDQIDSKKYFRDELAVIQLDQPSIESCDPQFPMPQKELDIINRFITTGEGETSVSHEWTKLYYHRMFDEPHSQIENLISKVDSQEKYGQAIMSLWDKTIDPYQRIAPCTLVVWARKKQKALELHVHARSSDAYKKLLMNLQEFIALHIYLAGRLSMPIGKYYHIIDSCHIHQEDKVAALAIAEKFANDKSCVYS